MKKLLITFFVIVGTFFVYKNANKLEPEVKNYHNIKNIEYYDEADCFFKDASEEDIVLFDVDETLTTSNDFLARGFQPPLLFKAYLAIAYFSEIFKQNKAEELYSRIWKQSPRFLVENCIKNKIDELKNRGCSVLALTAINSGKCGVIENMPVWRYENLKKLGIEFSQNFEDCSYEQLKAFRGTYPVLFKGILCCNRCSKGDVLEAFLKQNSSYFKEKNIKPRITFFDDKYYELLSVGQTCKKLNLNYNLYWYNGAKRSGGNKFNYTETRKRIKRLVETGAWDEVAA